MLLTFHVSWRVDESLAGHRQLKPSGYSFYSTKKLRFEAGVIEGELWDSFIDLLNSLHCFRVNENHNTKEVKITA